MGLLLAYIITTDNARTLGWLSPCDAHLHVFSQRRHAPRSRLEFHFPNESPLFFHCDYSRIPRASAWPMWNVSPREFQRGPYKWAPPRPDFFPPPVAFHFPGLPLTVSGATVRPFPFGEIPPFEFRPGRRSTLAMRWL